MTTKQVIEELRVSIEQEDFDGLHNYSGRLIDDFEKAIKALDTAVYDLMRIRDADWGVEQMRMGARSGASVALEALKDLGYVEGEA